jgi:25S rRNA (cytosine2278-C5)-methyltransferase
VIRHKARLTAEFTKIRVRLGYASIELFRNAVNTEKFKQSQEPISTKNQIYRHPRWIRINTLRCQPQALLHSAFTDFERVSNLKKILTGLPDDKLIYIDDHIPHLAALPSGFDLSKLEAYKCGDIIVQDKASCFPAYLLDVEKVNGDIIDACAAPGNKTTQLAALCRSSTKSGHSHRIHAFEKDKNRSQTLSKMVQQAGASALVTVHAQSDFLLAAPTAKEYNSVTAILLDPSCSGSGIIGRDDETKLELPNTGLVELVGNSKTKKRKRKQEDHQQNNVAKRSSPLEVLKGEEAGEGTHEQKRRDQRLDALSAFQLRLLKHAMTFPSVSRIVYSTCSTHEEENERVVIQALASEIGCQRGWTILPRTSQVTGLQKWHTRGDIDACARIFRGLKMESTNILSSAGDIADGCVRCEKSTEAGTIGFFVAGFVREVAADTNASVSANGTDASSDEWNGFSDTD